MPFYQLLEEGQPPTKDFWREVGLFLTSLDLTIDSWFEPGGFLVLVKDTRDKKGGTGPTALFGATPPNA